MVRKEGIAPRAPRIGVDETVMAGLGIDLSRARVALTRGQETEAATLKQIINVSSGGMKIVCAGFTLAPAIDDKLDLSIAGNAKDWTMRGRVAWTQDITGGLWWLGIEFAHTAAWMELFGLLTGETE